MNLLYPVDCPITQTFGENPALYARFGVQGHNGIDFGCGEGTPVRAAAAGTATKIQTDPDGYGLHVRLTHPWGRTIYAHLSQVLCRIGQRITEGEIIARTGNSGFSTGPHLHFEVRLQGQESNGFGGAVDPLPLLQQGITPVSSQAEAAPQGSADETPAQRVIEQAVPSGVITVSGYVQVIVAQLFIRCQPSLSAQKAGLLYAGAQAQVLSITQDDQGNQWLQVFRPSGWVAAHVDGKSLVKPISQAQ